MSQTGTTSTVPSRARALFSFPHPVNEVSARLVAGGVVVMSVLTIALNLKWATAVIAYGFVARVLTGPSLSPLGQLMTRVVTPRLSLAARHLAHEITRPRLGFQLAEQLTGAFRHGRVIEPAKRPYSFLDFAP